MNPSPASGPSTQQLSILYTALAAGVFLYAAVLLFALEPIGAVENPTSLRIAWLVVAVGVTVMTGFVQARIRSGIPDESRATYALLVWGMAEGQALLGLTGYLLSGDRVLMTLSLALFAYLYLRYPPSAFTSGR